MVKIKIVISIFIKAFFIRNVYKKSGIWRPKKLPNVEVTDFRMKLCYCHDCNNSSQEEFNQFL